MQSGTLMNGSHGAFEAHRAKAVRMDRVLAAVGQTLPAITWYGLTGEFSIVLNYSKSTLTHVRTFASRRGEADKYATDRYRASLKRIEKACSAAIACVPNSEFTGSITIEFTHANGIVSHGNTIFGSIVEIRG